MGGGGGEGAARCTRSSPRNGKRASERTPPPPDTPPHAHTPGTCPPSPHTPPPCKAVVCAYRQGVWRAPPPYRPLPAARARALQPHRRCRPPCCCCTRTPPPTLAPLLQLIHPPAVHLALRRELAVPVQQQLQPLRWRLGRHCGSAAPPWGPLTAVRPRQGAWAPAGALLPACSSTGWLSTRRVSWGRQEACVQRGGMAIGLAPTPRSDSRLPPLHSHRFDTAPTHHHAECGAEAGSTNGVGRQARH